MLNYIGFYNYSVEDFKISEAQVWVGVKLPRGQDKPVHREKTPPLKQYTRKFIFRLYRN